MLPDEIYRCGNIDIKEIASICCTQGSLEFYRFDIFDKQRETTR